MAREGQTAEFEVVCENRVTGKRFRKEFHSYYTVSKFVRKCHWSKKIRILWIDDLYDRGYSYWE